MSRNKQLTVAEVIEVLQGLPQDSPVYYFTGKKHMRFYPVNFICHVRDPVEEAKALYGAAREHYHSSRAYISSNKYF